MPVDVVILVRFRRDPDETDVTLARRDLLAEVVTWEAYWTLDADSFHDGCPMRRVTDDYVDLDALPPGVWYELGLAWPVYDRGYERGDLQTHVRLAEWLERRFPEAEVWHGIDADPESAVTWPHEARRALLDYFEQVGHEPYDRPRRRALERPSLVRRVTGWLRSLLTP